MAAPLRPRKSYALVPGAKLEVFYSGGPARLVNNALACACNDEVRVVDPATGVVGRTLEGDGEPITALALWAPPSTVPGHHHTADDLVLFAASRSLRVRRPLR